MDGERVRREAVQVPVPDGAHVHQEGRQAQPFRQRDTAGHEVVRKSRLDQVVAELLVEGPAVTHERAREGHVADEPPLGVGELPAVLRPPGALSPQAYDQSGCLDHREECTGRHLRNGQSVPENLIYSHVESAKASLRFEITHPERLHCVATAATWITKEMYATKYAADLRDYFGLHRRPFTFL